MSRAVKTWVSFFFFIHFHAEDSFFLQICNNDVGRKVCVEIIENTCHFAAAVMCISALI